MADPSYPDPPEDDPASNEEPPEPSYRVGYGRPPREHQFPKGRSGNRNGRPAGARGLRAELKAELDELVTITIDGKPRRIRKRRLVIKALAAKAAKGDVRAADKLLSLVIQAEGFEDQRSGPKKLSEADEEMLSRFLNEGSTSLAEEFSPAGDDDPHNISAPDQGDNR